MSKLEVLIIIAIVFVALVLIPLQPYFEMKAFNKFSSKKASYCDAVFLNLRVEAK